MLLKYANWPKKSRRRKISALLCSILLISAIAGAAVVAPVPVFALSAGGIKGTIASIILSLLLQTGTAPVNNEWLTSLNAAYGAESTIGTIEQCITNGLLTETAGGLVDTGLSAAIEAAPEYTSLGLSEIFTTTAADTGVSVASGGVNIANTAINVGTVGTIGAFAGAAAIGVGVGVLANKVYNYVSNYVKYGLPMTQEMRNTIINNIPTGYSKVYYYVTQINSSLVNSGFYFTPYDVICIGRPSGRGFTSTIRARDNITVDKAYKGYSNEVLNNEYTTNNTSGPYYTAPSGSVLLDRKIDVMAESIEDASNIYERWNNGEIILPDTKSPDIITPSGNASIITGSDGKDIINGQGNIVPEGYDMIPVDVEDYLNFADDANNNTQNGDTGQDTQGEAFDDFVDPYIIPQEQEPDQPIIPENPDVPTPEYPDRPLIPDQPTVPDKPDPTPDDITDMTDMMTTTDLKSVFPFCIPWDLYNLFHIFDTGENRRAPHIEFTFPGTDWHIDVDLAQFDPVAALLRLLELIVFIAGLAVATRALIGANG